MTKMKSLLTMLALCAAGCSPAGDSPAVEDGETGDLSVELVGTDSSGQQYRLRNADFYIYGYSFLNATADVASSGSAGVGGGVAGGPSGGTSIIVSSETNPNDPIISTRVLPGSYTVTLSSDWYLEKLTPTGPELVEQSVLLSEQTQYAYVWHNGVTNIFYRFGVDGELIDFRHGDINIGIDIEHPGEGEGGFGGFGPGGSAGAGGFGPGGSGTGGFGPAGSGTGGFGGGFGGLTTADAGGGGGGEGGANHPGGRRTSSERVAKRPRPMTPI
jgi:hypothetical protein